MITFFCDGASRVIGGESRGFIGIVGFRDGEIVKEHAAAMGVASCNEAQYDAIIGAVGPAKRMGERRVQLLSNSQLN